MNGSRLLKCRKCGKPLGYVTLTPKSALEVRPDLDNVVAFGTCMECAGGSGFYQRNF